MAQASASGSHDSSGPPRPVLKPARAEGEVVQGGGRDHPDRLKGMWQLQTPIVVGGREYKLRFHRESGDLELGELRTAVVALKPEEERAAATSMWAQVRFKTPGCLTIGSKKIPSRVTRAGALAWAKLPKVLRPLIEQYPQATFEEWSSVDRYISDVDRYDVAPWVAPSPDHRIFVHREGGHSQLVLQKGPKAEFFLHALASDRRFFLATLIRKLWATNKKGIGSGTTGIFPHIVNLLRAKFGQDAVLLHIPSIRTESMGASPVALHDEVLLFDGPTEPVKGDANPGVWAPAISLEATLWLCERYEPRLLPLVQSLADFKVPVEMAQYTGARSLSDRAQDVLTLATVDVHHLAALTFSKSVTDGNADGFVNVRKLRMNGYDENTVAQMDRLQQFRCVVEDAKQDRANDSPKHVPATLHLPVDDSGVVSLVGTFSLGIGSDHPHLGCHLCGFSTANGYQNMFAHHYPNSHGMNYKTARKGWTDAAAGWDVLLYNVDFPAFSTIKARYHLWNWYYEDNEEGLVNSAMPLVRRNEERDKAAFGKEGDTILYFIITHSRPCHPFLDSWAYLHSHPAAGGSNRSLLEMMIFLLSVFNHLLEPSHVNMQTSGWEVRASLSTLGNAVPGTSIKSLLLQYGPSAAFMANHGASELLANVLSLLGERYSIRATRHDHTWQNSKFMDVRGTRVEQNLWPFTWKTLTLETLPEIDFPERLVSLRRKKWIIILVWRRTRNGGWVLVDGHVVCVSASLQAECAEMLEKYLEAGQFRYDLIIEETGLAPGETPYIGTLLNGCPADSPAVPNLQSIKGVKGYPDIKFAGHQNLFQCNGFIGDSEVILSLAAFDGLFLRDDTLVSFFEKWRGGYLAILTEDRRMQGLQKPAKGIYFHTYVYIPAFVFFLLDLKATQMEENARYAIENECITEAELEMQQDVLAEAQEIRKSTSFNRTLSPKEVSLFTAVRDRLREAEKEREYLKAMRNVKRGSLGRAAGSGDLMLDPDDWFDADDDDLDVTSSPAGTGLQSAASVAEEEMDGHSIVMVDDLEESRGDPTQSALDRVQQMPHVAARLHVADDEEEDNAGSEEEVDELASERSYRLRSPDRRPGLVAGDDDSEDDGIDFSIFRR